MSEPNQWRSSRGQWALLREMARDLRKKPTDAEARLWLELRKKSRQGIKFRRQHVIDRYIVDFYCREASLVIEIDGKIHQKQKENDAIRQEFLKSTGLKVIRFTNEEVGKKLPLVLRKIDQALAK